MSFSKPLTAGASWSDPESNPKHPGYRDWVERITGRKNNGFYWSDSKKKVAQISTNPELDAANTEMEKILNTIEENARAQAAIEKQTVILINSMEYGETVHETDFDMLPVSNNQSIKFNENLMESLQEQSNALQADERRLRSELSATMSLIDFLNMPENGIQSLNLTDDPLRPPAPEKASEA